jgi:transposase
MTRAVLNQFPRVANYVIKNGLQWKDAPQEYGSHKTLYNHFVRWSKMCIFNRIFAELAGKEETPDRLMIDATHLKAHRTAASLLKKEMFPAVSGAPRAAELKASCGLRRSGQAYSHAPCPKGR